MRKSLLCITVFILCISLSACGHKTKPVQLNSSGTSSDITSSSEPVESSSAAPSSSTPQQTSSTVSTVPKVPAKVYVNVAIIEGKTVQQIASTLETAGVLANDAAKADFLAKVNSYSFTESIMSSVRNDPSHIIYRLEGYLYPNTYQFYKGMKPEDAIGVMLKGAVTAKLSNYSRDTIIMASIIQREAATADDMKKVSAVIHNRINAKMMLQVDSTTIYLNDYTPSSMLDTYKYFYSTKRIYGLPAGPICNPGKQALDAAANPDNDSYLYFASDKAGHYLFATTLAEQEANCVTLGVSTSDAEQ